MRKYALDTNLYVHAFRDADRARDLERFFEAHAPATYLSSVVLHELLAGSDTAAKARQIERSLARPLSRTGRVFTPTHAVWQSAGETLARMAREEKLELRRVPKSLVNDVLIATSCRESGVVLVTENVRDFERIRRYVDVQFEPPWPATSG